MCLVAWGGLRGEGNIAQGANYTRTTTAICRFKPIDPHDKLLNKTFFLSTFSWTGIERLKDACDAIVDRRTQGMPHGTP